MLLSDPRTPFQDVCIPTHHSVIPVFSPTTIDEVHACCASTTQVTSLLADNHNHSHPLR
jgi:hypothetical protein